MSEVVPRRSGDDGLDAAAALIDPSRRKLYSFVAGAEEPVGRDEAAEAASISRSLAGYHLDQLVEDGLLEVSYARRTGRTGPGAGRPAKLYRRANIEVTVQLPPRDDAFVAGLLATAIEADPSGVARTALRKATRDAGRALGRELAGASFEPLVDALNSRGYAPAVSDECIRLRNCPFHHLVTEHLDLVCMLNRDLLTAAVASAEVGLQADLDPQPGQCCVVLRPRRSQN